MINYSKAFKNELYRGDRNYIERADITLLSGEELSLSNKDLWKGGLSFDDMVSGDNSFDVGAAIINKCAVTISNIYDDYSEYDFGQAKVIASVGLTLPDGTQATEVKGTYTVDEAKYSSGIIVLTCLDNMKKFDKSYKESTLIYPATLSQIVREACAKCDVILQTIRFPHDDFVVDQRPADETITFRTVISWAAQIAGCFCRCDTYGRLELKWYDMEALDRMMIDGGSFKPWTSGETIDGGSFSPWTSGDSIDGGEFGDRDSFHNIYSTYSMNISTDDVVITGVRVLEKTKEEEKEAIITYQAGTDGYVVSIENNSLIQDGAGEQVAEWLGNSIIGTRFRKADLSHASDPSIEAGDVALLTDRKGNSYKILISSTRFTTGGAQSTTSSAQSPARNSAEKYSAETKNYVENRELVGKERTDRELAIEQLNTALSNSPGMYVTEKPPGAPNAIRYLHDKPTLEESKNVIKITSEAIGISNDGGETYPYGIEFSGTAILEKIYTIGLNASYINSGELSIQDENGNQTFFADTETGVIRIVANSFSLASGNTTKTIDDIAKEKADAELADFVSTVYDPKIANLQSQIDGQIETWYYDHEPTLTNAPASSWTTEAERARHEGDLFYWKSKGYSYRFFKDGGSWKWQLITDSDITKALKTASTAKDTADAKRRIFSVQPVPPYDVGDLWTQGKEGDIKSCVKARVEGQGFVGTDWELASNYIDRTKVPDAWADKDSGVSLLQIFNKLTNEGRDQCVKLEGGKLYINGEFIQARGLNVVNSSGKSTFYVNPNGEVSINTKELSWTSTYSSMSSDGKLTCTAAELSGDITTQAKIGDWDFTSKIGEVSTKYFGEEKKRGGFSVSVDYRGSGTAQHGEITICPAPYDNVNSYSDRAYNIINSNHALWLQANGGYGNSTRWSGIQMTSSEMSFYMGDGNTAYGRLSINRSGGEMSGTWDLPSNFRGTVNSVTTGEANVAMGESDSSYLSKSTKSSKRYKEIRRSITSEDVEQLYNITPVLAKYRPDYLSEADERYGVEFPMFIAEDIDQYMPLAVDHDEKGRADNWNVRILIPCMFQMIKEQKREIEELKRKINL